MLQLLPSTSLSLLPICETVNLVAALDSACTIHVVPKAFPASPPTVTPEAISIGLPNGAQLSSNLTTQLPIDTLPSHATRAYIVPEFDKMLVSVKQLTEVGCKAVFERDDATVTYNGDIIMQAPINKETGLWEVTFPRHSGTIHTPQHSCNAIITGSTVPQRIAYYHACCFSPVLSTWCDAIDAGFFLSFPELTSKLVKKHPPQSRAMQMGHLDQSRAGVQSTQPIEYQPSSGQRRQLIAEIVPCTSFNATTYLDLPAPFLLKSSRGHKYLLIVYDTDSNYIFAEPITSREGPTIKAAYQRVVETLTAKGFKPELTITDNESSALLKTYMISQGIEYQLTPDVHRRNAAERAIRTFKNHFVAGLCSLDPDFPLHLWDRLLPQALLTLNLLRASNVNPLLSAHAQLFGAYDFTKNPIAPPGTRVIFHVKPNKREPWAPHGTPGWYLGPTMEHYRSWKVFNPATRAEIFSDTLAWFPQQVTMPTASSSERVNALINDLIYALHNPSPASALSPLTHNQHAALLDLADIFQSHTDPPSTTTANEDQDDTQPPAVPPTILRQSREDIPTTAIHPEPISEPEPRVGSTTTRPEPRVGTPHAITRTQPRVGRSVSFPIATYSRYNPNGPQRRRQATRATLESNQLTPPTAPSPTPTRYAAADTVDEDQSAHDSEAETIPTSNTNRNTRLHTRLNTSTGSRTIPMPACLAQPDDDNDNESEPRLFRGHIPGMKKGLRKSTRITPVYRFDHRTHRRVPLTEANLPTLPNLFPTQQHQANAVTTSLSHRKLLQGPDAEEWSRATSLEFGRLAQGLPGKVEGTNTIFFIAHGLMPAHKKATYFRVVCTHKPLKPEPYRVRGTVGGDKIDYPGDVSAPTVDATTVNILLNDVVSTPDAQLCTGDVKNFYLNTPLADYEYVRIPITSIPLDIREHYNLDTIVQDGFVMAEIRKGIYGLPQSGKLANDLVVERLEAGGYRQCPHTPGLFRHESNGVTFTLWVDDFAIKYVDRSAAEHLLTLLGQHYELEVDWTGTKYLGLTLEWDYINRKVYKHMPGYVKKALIRFGIEMPDNPQHSPHAWTAPSYGAGAQYDPDTADSPPLSPSGIKRLQEVIGVLLYYARMVDSTMLVALGTLASAQSQGTQATMDAAIQLLNYAATHPDATVMYEASEMCLHVTSDASYLSVLGARSRAGGYFYLSSNTGPTAPKPDDPSPPFNGAVHVHSSIIKAVMSSATEAETGALFYNAKEACTLRNTLEDLGYPQPATPIQTDNACAVGIVNSSIKQKRSKAMDMRFYWLRDRIKQGQFQIYWRKGADNDADYFTKHHSPSHHRSIRSRYLTDIPKQSQATCCCILTSLLPSCEGVLI